MRNTHRVAKLAAFALIAATMAVSIAYAGEGLAAHPSDATCTSPTTAVTIAPFDDASGPTTTTLPTTTTTTTPATTTTLPVCNTPDQSFIIAAYTDFLGRAPTPTELSTGATALAGGENRADFVTALANSPEWIAHIVNQLYENTLGREADSGGLAYWSNELQTGAETVADVSAHFYASSEYFNGIGGGTNTSWVTDLYQKLLDRAPDDAGLAYWVGQVSSTSRFSVAYRFFQSNESAVDRVTTLYNELLGRAPDPGGTAFWAPKVIADGDIALAIDLASSNEYYTRAAIRFP